MCYVTPTFCFSTKSLRKREQLLDRQFGFIGHVVQRQGLENLCLTMKVEGSWTRGRETAMYHRHYLQLRCLLTGLSPVQSYSSHFTGLKSGDCMNVKIINSLKHLYAVFTDGIFLISAQDVLVHLFCYITNRECCLHLRLT